MLWPPPQLVSSLEVLLKVSEFERRVIMNDMSLSEPPKSIAIVQNNNPIQQGGQITVVDGQVSHSSSSPSYNLLA